MVNRRDVMQAILGAGASLVAMVIGKREDVQEKADAFRLRQTVKVSGSGSAFGELVREWKRRGIEVDEVRLDWKGDKKRAIAAIICGSVARSDGFYWIWISDVGNGAERATMTLGSSEVLRAAGVRSFSSGGLRVGA